MSEETITILTEPFTQFPLANWRAFKQFIKKILHYRQRGPAAVLRSLSGGLKFLGIHFNCNPKNIKEVAETVVVLSNLEALKEAIELKKAGKIKKLLAGPNLVILPSDHLDLITDPLIDYYLVNSQWTYDLYIQEAPALSNRCLIWPAGVDVDFWNPEKNLKTGTVLIYEKTENIELIKHCEAVLQDLGYSLLRIKYGQYIPKEYLSQLRKVEFAVFFSQSESQGIALIEAWAVNVTTLVWNPGSAKFRNQVGVEKLWTVSSAPYLTDQTGLFFQSAIDFKNAVELYSNRKEKFSPRRWVLEHMTDAVSARKLCCDVGIIDLSLKE